MCSYSCVYAHVHLWGRESFFESKWQGFRGMLVDGGRSHFLLTLWKLHLLGLSLCELCIFTHKQPPPKFPGLSSKITGWTRFFFFGIKGWRVSGAKFTKSVNFPGSVKRHEAQKDFWRYCKQCLQVPSTESPCWGLAFMFYDQVKNLQPWQNSSCTERASLRCIAFGFRACRDWNPGYLHRNSVKDPFAPL